MTADFKVCPRCGQRMVLTMVQCGRCGNYMPHPPGMGPAIYGRSQVAGALALLCVLLAISALVFLNRRISTPPFVGKWYDEFGGTLTFAADGSFDPGFPSATRRKWLASGNLIQVFSDNGRIDNYVWSMNLDGQSMNLYDESNRTREIWYKTPRSNPALNSRGGGLGGDLGR